MSALVLAGPASSDTVLGCGSVVTESVVLAQDIGPCAGSGLVVATGGVSVDLNGHTVSGPGAGAGIEILAGSESPVTVRNGTVVGFGVGVSVREGDTCAAQTGAVTIERIESRRNGTGLSVFTSRCDAPINMIGNRVIGNTGDGIFAGGADPTRIVGNRIARNGGIGINGAFDSVRVVADNFVARNDSDGIRLADTVSSVTNNVMLRNGGVGLSISETVPTFIPLYVVAGNVANRNAGGGMSAAASFAPPGPPAGQGNYAKHNGVFQCVVIVCASNRGQEKKHSGAP